MKNEKIKMLLQLFAEEGGTENGADGEGGAGGAGIQNGSGDQSDTKTGLKYTDADLDRILGKKFAEWQQKRTKEVSEAERLAKMSAEEKANEHVKSLEKRVLEFEQREARNEMMRQARALLDERDINASDAILVNLIADDADNTKLAVENFAKEFETAVENAVKAKLKSETPRSGAPSGLTREQIMNIQNRSERQRLIKENMHLFK